MLDFSWSHILIVIIVALVVVGPKDLPRLMRVIGQWANKARGMANEFRRSFDEMARQAELQQLREEIEALKKDNPLSDVAAELNQSVSAEAAPVTGETALPPMQPAPHSDTPPEKAPSIPPPMVGPTLPVVGHEP